MKDNTAVIIAVESLPSRKIGRVSPELAETARFSNLVGFALNVIEGGSSIKTDGATNLKASPGRGYQHRRFVGVDRAEPAHIDLPCVQMVGSLLKQRLTGTLHFAVSQEHLAYYPWTIILTL